MLASIQMCAFAGLACCVAAGPSDDSFREDYRCGQNCLVGYLRLHGRLQTTIDDVNRAVPPDPSGSSLLELRDAAGELGVASKIIQSRPLNLASLDLPAIAHLHGKPGHFVLLLEATANSVTVADMTMCTIDQIRKEDFDSRWTGSLLLPRHSPSSVAFQGVGIAIVLLSLFILAHRWWKRR